MSYLIDFEPLLKTEYSKKFDEIRKGLVLQSYYKYGKDRKSTRLNSSHIQKARMPSSA